MTNIASSAKTCHRCGERKELGQFHRSAHSKDGRQAMCKICIKEWNHNYIEALKKNPEWLEKQRARYIKLNEAAAIRFPERLHLRKVDTANKKRGFHNHHWSYKIEHARDVIELSVSDHRKAHMFLKYDQALCLFRTPAGKLLDTREKHEQYLKEVLQQPAQQH